MLLRPVVEADLQAVLVLGFMPLPSYCVETKSAMLQQRFDCSTSS